MKSKKKVLGGNRLFNFSKGGNLKKSLENPGLDLYIIENACYFIEVSVILLFKYEEFLFY